MEILAALFLILALALLVALFVGRPFILPHTVSNAAARSAAQQSEHVRSNLLAERDRVLEALQELDFDNALGKIPSEDYPIQRAALLQSGADILRQLDAIEAGAGGPNAISTEDRIEAAVAAHRADAVHRSDATGANGMQRSRAAGGQAVVSAGGTNGSNSKDALEEMIAARKRERKESAGGFCPGCGRPVQKSDKFCSRCGKTL